MGIVFSEELVYCNHQGIRLHRLLGLKMQSLQHFNNFVNHRNICSRD